MNRKKIIIIFGALLIVIAIAGILIIKNMKNDEEQETIIEEYTPEAEITEEQARNTIVSLYFPSKEKHEITPEARLVDIKEIINTPYEKLLNMLTEGPKNDKLERIIPEGTKVLKTYMEDDVLVIDLSKDFLNYDMENENTKSNMIKCIVNTLTELTEVNKVQILIEGNKNDQFNEIYTRVENEAI